MSAERPAPPPLDATPEAAKARGRRNLAIALALVGFAVLLFVVTMARLAGQTPRLIY